MWFRRILDVTLTRVHSSPGICELLSNICLGMILIATHWQFALALAEGKRIATVEPLAFYQNVSPSQELRDAANAAEVAVKDFLVDSSMRLDVFRAKQAAKKNIEESKRVLSPEERRLVEKMILDGTRAGLALPDAEREKLTALNKELSQTCSEFCVSAAVLSPNTITERIAPVLTRKIAMRRR